MSAIELMGTGRTFPFLVDIPWPNGCELVYNITPSGMGKGELSTVAALMNVRVKEPVSDTVDFLKQFLSGHHDTHDIKFRRDVQNVHTDYIDRVIEVKELPTILLGDEGIFKVATKFKFFTDLALELRQAVIALNEMLELYLGPNIFAKLDEFSRTDVDMFMRSSASRGRLIGDQADSKYIKQKFGLYQAVRTLSCIKKAKMLRIQGEKWKVRFSKDGVLIKHFLDVPLNKVVGVHRFLFKEEDPECVRREVIRVLCSKFEMNECEANVLYYLDHPAFDDPEMVIRAFHELAAPSTTLENVDILVLVTPTHFKLIPSANFDDGLDFVGLTRGGRPQYRLNSEGLKLSYAA